MSINRVQKLLFSEYCDFEDLVLIESPFAQTTKEGKGLRQVHLGLTPSKLILATDILPPVEIENVTFNPRVDPEIETFELIAIYPVECVNLSIYRRKKRQAIKARFCNNRVLYFELGGFERRGMFWNLWCEKVKFLCPADSATSRSETSVATSTTGSSLYLIDKRVVTVNGIRQLWCKFGPNLGIDTRFINEVVSNNSKSLVKKWTDRYLYLGKDLHETSLDYQPIMKLPNINEFVRWKKLKSRLKPVEHPSLADQKGLSFGDSVHVNRFGSGIFEGCNTGLYLTFDDYVVPRRYSTTVMQTTSSDPSIDWRSIDYEELAETAVLIWEYYGFTHSKSGFKIRHRRRYGFAPKPLFLYGLGPWQVTKGDRFSLQWKRALSDVNLRNLNLEKHLKLPVSKRQLLATVSCPVLNDENEHKTNNIINAPKKPVIFFWTPGYWYRPISAKDAYSDLQKHLKRIKDFHEVRQKCKRRKYNSRRFLRKCNTVKDKETDEEGDDDFSQKKKRKPNFILNMFGAKIDDDTMTCGKSSCRVTVLSCMIRPDGSYTWSAEETLELLLKEYLPGYTHLNRTHQEASSGDTKHPNETPLQHLKRILRLDVNMTAWDFDSTTLAQQLTMIDRDLLLKITSSELSVLLWQQTSRNAPNIAAMIAFSYRISCLIASEILREESERMRARLMARFINVANKCHRIANFQSCRSVLCGLQNPAIFRLRKTWAYVRKKHASKYQAFEFLCRLYRDPRMPSFQKAFFVFSQHPPFLPYIGHIVTKLFDKVPEYNIQMFRRPASRQISFCTTTSYRSSPSISSDIPAKPHEEPNLFSKLFNVFSNPTTGVGGGDGTKLKPAMKKRKAVPRNVKLKGLYEYFKPIGMFEDNRFEILSEVGELLEKCQLGAMHYNFNSNEMTRNFLLKARHFDDQDNFFNSLSLEPTCRNKNE